MKKAISWLALVAGIGPSILLLGFLGAKSDPGPYWVIFIVAVIFVSVPLATSLIAIRNRRQAAWMFLIQASILVFCAAFLEVITQAWDYQDGWLRSSAIVLIPLLYLISIILAAIAFYMRRHVFLLLVASAVTALFPFAFSLAIQFSQGIDGSLLIAPALFVILGLFWVGTDYFGWPTVIPARPRSMSRRIVGVALTSALLLFLVIMATAAVEIPGPPPMENCSNSPRLAEHKNSMQAVFVAKVVLLGSPVDFDAKASYWAVVSVQERFWGLPWWFPKYLILSHGFFKNGESYLIDQERPTGLIGRFLPVISFPICLNCIPVQLANVKLRVLRDGPPKTGVRVIGQVRAFLGEEDGQFRGTNVVIQGPSASVTATLDQYGVYDVSGLPPGQYEVRPEMNKQLYQTYGCASKSPELKSGEVWGCDVNVREIRKLK